MLNELFWFNHILENSLAGWQGEGQKRVLYWPGRIPSLVSGAQTKERTSLFLKRQPWYNLFTQVTCILKLFTEINTN
jgi:hypothetical protein